MGMQVMTLVARMTVGLVGGMLMKGNCIGAAVAVFVILFALGFVLFLLVALLQVLLAVGVVLAVGAVGYAAGRGLTGSLKGAARWAALGLLAIAPGIAYLVGNGGRASVPVLIALGAGAVGVVLSAFWRPQFTMALPDSNKSPAAMHRDPVTNRVIPELPGVVFIGRSGPDPRNAGYLMSGEKMAVILVGQSQSGKTSGVFVPTILSWKGSLIATSTKSDIIRDTLDARRYWAGLLGGAVHVYDPMGSSPHLISVRWAPHQGCEDQAACQRRIASLVNALPSANDPKADYFIRGSERLLRPLFHAAALEKLKFSEVLRWLKSARLAANAVLILRAHGADNFAEDLQSLLRDEAPTTLGNIFGTALSVFGAVGSKAVELSTAASDLDIDTFLATGSTLYILPPAMDQKAVGPLVAGFIEAIVDRAYALARQQRSGRLEPPLLLALDELANIAPLPELPTILSQGISQGILTLMGLQTLSQLRDRFGKDKAESILGSSHVRVLWGNQFAAEAEEVSKLIGERQIEVGTQHKPGLGGPLFGSQSVTKQFVRIMPPDALRGMPPGEAICLYVGREACKVWTPPVAQAADPLFGHAYGASTLRNDPLRRRP
jgi:type IV secretion system protein VirD4